MDPEKKSCGISFTPKEKNYCFDEITLSIVVGLGGYSMANAIGKLKELTASATEPAVFRQQLLRQPIN
jgi:hypothetical protein